MWDITVVVTVYEIVPGSLSDKAGIKAGDVLHTVNGHEISDVLDYRFYIFESRLELKLSRNGVFFQVKICKDTYADIGMEFETYLMDKKRSCHNRCIFCFIDQLPKGMRETLYFKDDDSRLSFLHGNYITLTNLKDSDIDRIIAMHMSPVNISVHTTDPELRVKMMRNNRAGEVLDYLRRLSDNGISMNCQIVLCRGINDGGALDRTMSELSELYPAVNSVSVVPAGLTKHREGLYPLSPYSPEECGEIIRRVTEFGEKCLKKYGTRLFFCGDELYIKAGLPLPDAEFYEEFAQIENGVGMMASMSEEFELAVDDAEADNISEAVAEPKTVTIATGVAAYGFIRELADRAEKLCPWLTVNVYAIRNDFFGESITVSGLITAQDIIAQLKGRELGQALLLPSVMLRAEGDLFLDGLTPDDVSRALGVPVRFVDNDGEGFFRALTEG